MSLIQLATKKSHFLSDSIHIVADDLKLEKEPEAAVFVVESLIADTLELFKLLTKWDEQHNWQSASDPDGYPFEANQKQIEAHFKQAIGLADDVLKLANQLKSDEPLQLLSVLEAERADFARMVADDPSFYQSQFFQQLVAEAIEDYHDERTEECNPVKTDG